MGEAFAFLFVSIFVVLGAIKLKEIIRKLVAAKFDGVIFTVYVLKPNEENAEMIVRSLAEEAEQNTYFSKSAVFIIDDKADESTKDIAYKTASQYRNVFVGELSELNEIIN